MKRIHERKRNRKAGYDYSRDNLYFFTACVQDRVCCFGKIVEGKMVLNEYGKIADQQWTWLGNQYGYLILHAFVVMPDHIHGVIEIDRSLKGPAKDLPPTNEDLSPQWTDAPKIKSLSELIGAYKTTASKKIHQAGYDDFSWQRSFHERIIRDDIAYRNIIRYIRNNPANWKKKKLDSILTLESPYT